MPIQPAMSLLAAVMVFSPATLDTPTSFPSRRCTRWRKKRPWRASGGKQSRYTTINATMKGALMTKGTLTTGPVAFARRTLTRTCLS